jgi:energy-coupling factor transporter transmembrane protein EcfT
MNTHNPDGEWMRADRRATRKGLKRYGLLNAAIVAGILFVAAGMPGHFLWHWIGVPLIILCACAFTPLLFYFGRFLWELIERR